MTQAIRRAVSEIDERTLVPLKTVVPICATLLAGMFWLNTKLSQIERGIHDSYSVQAMGRWSQKLQDDNPALKVPNPYNFTEHTWPAPFSGDLAAFPHVGF